MDKRVLLPLFLILFLPVRLSKGNPDTESLWVDGYDGTDTQWSKSGITPYLGDNNDYIYAAKGGYVDSWYSFANPSGGGTDIINSVTLYLECQGDGGDSITVNIHDGSTDNPAGSVVPDTSYSYKTISVGGILDSWGKIQSAALKVTHTALGKANEIDLRRAYLYVDYTPGGAIHVVDVDQAISWSGSGTRLWTAFKKTTQGITIAVTGSRGTGVFNRFSTGTITFTSNAYASIIQYIQRTVTIGVSLASSASRQIDYIRMRAQSINFGGNALRRISIVKTLTQSLSFTLEGLGEKITGGITHIRDLTLGLTLTLNAFAEKLTGITHIVDVTLDLLFYNLDDVFIKVVAGSPVVDMERMYASYRLMPIILTISIISMILIGLRGGLSPAQVIQLAGIAITIAAGLALMTYLNTFMPT